ncbi:hypothetical protein ONZ43_g5822 [Nemania bipapillata]|uniref:Uncharacterized protein n=1 Tax=Nemania bipapillata TaxID=110536 RepID=A0ACC2I661_9PEZI|nr:hypothetical protein ONZ43_g5822 [Nemania bipapillata]
MALQPPPNPAGSSHQRSLTPTASSFTPRTIESNKEVLRPWFVTQTVPDAHRFAGIVGLCTVPEDKADMNNLGWHIADFLAFRALLCGENPPKAQTWLSMCDIPALVEANPLRYTHGKDRRQVGSAVRPRQNQEFTGPVERADDIQVETCAEVMKQKFISAVKQKLRVVEKSTYPLLLIICGLTSLEQDIYFGKLDTNHRYTMKDLRHELGESINNIEATIITPSLFSAGWQVNISFGRLDSATMRGKRAEFLARQFGGAFAEDLVRSFLGWKCPVIDQTRVETLIKRERFPGPACPSGKVQALVSELQIKIQSYLVGGLSSFPMDHSFSFNKGKDEWEILIGRREKSLDYPGLEYYGQRWGNLPSAQRLDPTDECFSFLGNAFGGTRDSQLNHIRYLIEESYLAWPDHWALSFGQETKRELERMMNTDQPSDIDCHEIFNILEHRARTSILGDTVVQYFDLPMPHNQRCRDWDYQRWKQELSVADRSSLIKHFASVLTSVPGPNLPPGINKNQLSKLQMRLESSANYVRAALGIRFLTAKESSKVAIDLITRFLEEVKAKQTEILASIPEVYLLCSSWLSMIDIPVREQKNAVSAARLCQTVMQPEDTIEILDSGDEYDVYQDDDVDLVEAPRATRKPYATFVHGHQPFSLVLARQKESPATENTRNIIDQEHETVAATPSSSITQARQHESLNSPQVADLSAEEARLIMELRGINERARREKLVTELLELVQNVASCMKAGQPNDMIQNDGSGFTDNSAPAIIVSTETKNDEGSDMKHEAGKEPSPQTQQPSGRKTPPHLRGISGRGYN